MFTALRRAAAAFALVALAVTSLGAQAQSPHLAYYLAPDDGGVWQVYQHVLDGESEPRQLTGMDADVQAFGVADDGLTIAYVGGGQLWSQSVHTDEATALTAVGSARVAGGPVYSADGDFIAYADDGVWLYDRVSGEATQLLADVAGESTMPSDFRIYSPERFVETEGGDQYLLVRSDLYEGYTIGVYNLATGAHHELEKFVHTSALPLSNGQTLVYGNNARWGDSALELAAGLDDLNAYERVLSFDGLSAIWLYAETAREIAPDVVRLTGYVLDVTDESDAFLFYFDFDAATGTAGDVQFVAPPAQDLIAHSIGGLSADGRLLPVFFDYEWGVNGFDTSGVQVLDLETGAFIAADFPDVVSGFRLQ